MNEKPKSQQFREGFVDEGDEGPVDQQPHQERPAQEPAEPFREQRPIVVKLMRKPIGNNKGDTVHELVFREPTGGDINRYGNPVRIDMNGDVIIDEKKMTTIMAVLSGILQPFIE